MELTIFIFIMVSCMVCGYLVANRLKSVEIDHQEYSIRKRIKQLEERKAKLEFYFELLDSHNTSENERKKLRINFSILQVDSAIFELKIVQRNMK